MYIYVHKAASCTLNHNHCCCCVKRCVQLPAAAIGLWAKHSIRPPAGCEASLAPPPLLSYVRINPVYSSIPHSCAARPVWFWEGLRCRPVCLHYFSLVGELGLADSLVRGCISLNDLVNKVVVYWSVPGTQTCASLGCVTN